MALTRIPLRSLLVSGLMAGSMGVVPIASQSAAPTGQAPEAFTILVTNDDGVDAPGLRALVEALQPIGRIVVAAPSRGQSGTGNTLPSPRQAIAVTSRIDENGVTWHSIDATPTACVLLAVTTLMVHRPDLVVSGINPGPNIAQAVYDSGTVGATRAAIWQGVPAISVSILGNVRQRYQQVGTFTRRLVDQLRANSLVTPGLFLKVSWPQGEPSGLRITKLSERYHTVTFTPCADTSPASCFNLRRTLPTDDDSSTDTGALAEGYVSITPMQTDVTAPGAHVELRALEQLWRQLVTR